MAPVAPHAPSVPPAACTPVFVLGVQRSGTTWLANLLCGHPDITGVEAAEHNGIHESVFFSHFAQAYGDLADDATFDRFATEFCASDYFLLSGCDEAWFRAQRPRTYPAAFRLVMDALAARRSARYWVEKSPHHTVLGPELAAAFPEARFVAVVRDHVSLIRSRIWAFGRTPPPYPRRLVTLLRACAASSFYQRLLEAFAHDCDRAIVVRYAALRADTEGEMRRVTAFIGVPYEALMLEERYRPNTSFQRGDRDRSRGLTRLDRFVIRIGTTLARLVPLPVLAHIEARRRRKRGVEWPSWVWKRRPRPSAVNQQQS